MRKKLKAGLLFGVIMTLAFLTGLVIDLIQGEEMSRTEILTDVIAAIIGGVIGGALYGYLAGTTTSWLIRKIKIDLEKGEEILFKTPANHWKGPECTGGALFLTNRRLVFKSHRVNVQNHQLSLPLPEISKVKRYKSARVLNNGLLLMTADGKEEMFVVEKAGEWEELLSRPGHQAPAA